VRTSLAPHPPQRDQIVTRRTSQQSSSDCRAPHDRNAPS